MGGKALTVFTRRYTKEEYFNLLIDVINKLSNHYEINLVDFIPSYFNKQDFGDLDLLVCSYQTNNLFITEIKDYLIKEFNSKEIVINGNVISFEYKEFQIDLIHISKENFKLAKTYFSFNDLGMFMGILAKRLNCKYGFDGLYYQYFTSDRSYKKDILLTKDINLIFNFLDLDINIFNKGFNDLEDIFKFVISSKYFDTKSFVQEEEWNHIRKTRNRKRPNWNKFLNYIEENNIKISNPKIQNIKYYISDYFGIDLVQQVDDLDNKLFINKIVKEKFNGKIVMNLTNLRDKKLGEFIQDYKNNKTNFEEFIINNNQENINEDIKLYFENYESL